MYIEYRCIEKITLYLSNISFKMFEYSAKVKDIYSNTHHLPLIFYYNTCTMIFQYVWFNIYLPIYPVFFNLCFLIMYVKVNHAVIFKLWVKILIIVSYRFLEKYFLNQPCLEHSNQFKITTLPAHTPTHTLTHSILKFLLHHLYFYITLIISQPSMRM